MANQFLHTRVTEMLGIQYPIIQAGMGFGISTPELVAAVSNAGGLGIFGAMMGKVTLRNLAAHKIAQIVTKERVTMPLRSPFTTQADRGRAGGHESVPRGHGMQRALGELLTCPHCMAPWVALALLTGYVFAPLPTRAITTLFSTVALASAFHHAYEWLEAEKSQAKHQSEMWRHEQQLAAASTLRAGLARPEA